MFNALFKRAGVFLILLFSISDLAVTAQIISNGDTTPLPSLLVKARKFAYDNSRAEARKICREILLRDSTYWDAAVLIGRTYIWDAKYD